MRASETRIGVVGVNSLTACRLGASVARLPRRVLVPGIRQVSEGDQQAPIQQVKMANELAFLASASRKTGCGIQMA